MIPYLLRIRSNDSEAYDVTDLLEQTGYTCIPFNDIDNEETTGRNTQDGNMQRSRITVKHSISITTVPLSSEEAAQFAKLVYPVWLTLEYFDPSENAMKTGTFYRDPGAPSFTTMLVRNAGSGYEIKWASVTVGFQEQ